MSTSKPDLTRIWANSAPAENVVDPDTTVPGKTEAGWTAEVPPFEHFNFIQQWLSKGLAHMNEQGISLWDTKTTYPVDALTKGSDGVVYVAEQEQSGNDPVSDGGANWFPAFIRAKELQSNTGATNIGTSSGNTVEVEIEALKNAQVGGLIVFTTYALLDTYTPQNSTEEKSSFKVTNDPTSSNNGYYSWVSGTTYTKDADLVVNDIQEANTSDAVSGKAVFDHSEEKFNENKTPGKNLLDKSEIRRGKYYSPGGNAISSSTLYRCSGFIPVVEGETYTYSQDQLGTTQAGGYFTSDSDGDGAGSIGGSIETFTVPIGQGITHIVLNIVSDDQDNTTKDGVSQLELGPDITLFEEYKLKVPLSEVHDTEDLLEKPYIIEPIPEKNLIDPSGIDYINRYSKSSEQMVVDNIGIAATAYIPVIEGETYTLSGEGIYNFSDPQGGYFTNTGDINAIGNIGFVLGQTFVSFTVPSGQGIGFVVLSLNKLNNDPGETELTGDAQAELGNIPTIYEPYNEVEKFKKQFIPQLELTDIKESETILQYDDILESYSKNTINPDEIDYIKRYSTGTLSFTVDTLGIAVSGYIPVIEGESYVVSGEAIYAITSPQGGYFTGAGVQVALSNISFSSDDEEAFFTVPTGQDITHVVISLDKLNNDPGETELNGNVQMELGVKATSYSPYNPVDRIQPSLLPAGSEVPVTDFDVTAWLKYTEGEDTRNQADKIPLFRKSWLRKDKDLTLVNVGTSLTARSIEHCTNHPDANERPPLFHSNNYASLLFDKLRWEGQEYRRYDYPSFFTETGNFSTSHDEVEWDDGARRNGLTRFSSDANCSVEFEIPVDAWQFNFIYRTDSVSTTSASISVAEGNGQLEVLNESEIWVEANGYSLSFVEPTPIPRTVSVPQPTLPGNDTTDISIASKSNTTYQKRMKFRCKSGSIDSRTISKLVTIEASSTGRLAYWGVEWSVREFMMTVINAARGGHSTNALSTLGLPRYADNEVWGFKPDLMFFENPIHNDGAAGVSVDTPDEYERLTFNYVFNNGYELSMKTRAAFFGIDPEIGMFTSSIAYNFGGIEEDGKLKFTEDTEGNVLTAFDKFSEAHNWVIETHPDVISINAVKRWVDAGNEIFNGNLKDATIGSGKDGSTFTNEGSHWNDTGCKIMAKTILSVFNFDY